MGKVLTAAEVTKFRQNGWLAPMRAISAAEAGAALDRIEAFEKQYGRAGNDLLRLRSHIVLPWVAALGRRKEILDVVEDIIGPNIRLLVSSIFSKAAQSPSFVSWHQDSSPLGLTPHESLTAWVAFSESTTANGCLRVLPGSHLGEDRTHVDTYDKDNLLGRGQAIADIDEKQAVNVELEPGQFSIHHERTAHGSGPNTTSRRRVGFSFFYIPTHVRSVGRGRRPSLLVRGVDTYGYWVDEIEPQAEMEPEALASLETMLGRYRDSAAARGKQDAG